jgi:hypothetical protein
MGTGENSGTWGTITNTNLGTAIEEAITGSADVTFASGTVTLTLTDTNSSQAARNLRLNLTGTSGGAQNLIVPTIEKVYIVNNGCADTITVKNTGGTGIAVPAGKTMYVYNNGTNVVDAITHLTSLTLETPLSVASGGTGSNTGINASTNVFGVLPVANGGTGSNSATFSGANITSLNATAVSSGTLSNDRTTAASANGASTIVARDASGNFTANTATLTTIIGAGSGLTSLNASNISSGTLSNDRLDVVSVAKGGTGTATPSLVGGTNITISGSWPNQTVTAASSAPPTTEQVLSATAGLTAGDIGSYALLSDGNQTSNRPNTNFGSTRAGNLLFPCGGLNDTDSGESYFVVQNSARSGTWRCLGNSAGQNSATINNPTTLWVRIS